MMDRAGLSRRSSQDSQTLGVWLQLESLELENHVALHLF